MQKKPETEKPNAILEQTDGININEPPLLDGHYLKCTKGGPGRNC